MGCFFEEILVELEETFASLNKGNYLDRSHQKLFSASEL